jgi:hypothetical protein
MRNLLRGVALGCLASLCLATSALAQTAPSQTAPYPTKNPNTLVPAGTTPSGATRLRLIADPAPPAAAAPSATATPLPPLPAPSGAAEAPSTVPIIPPGAIPPNAGDSSYPPREPIRREPPPTNDPTVPGPAIRELLGQGDQKTPNAPQATPELPLVRLRARVAVRDKPVIAIVEIDGRLYSVRPGDEFSVNVDKTPTPMKVLKLTATEMQLELVKRQAIINLN